MNLASFCVRYGYFPFLSERKTVNSQIWFEEFITFVRYHPKVKTLKWVMHNLWRTWINACRRQRIPTSSIFIARGKDWAVVLIIVLVFDWTPSILRSQKIFIEERQEGAERMDFHGCTVSSNWVTSKPRAVYLACACHHVKHSEYHSCLWHFIVFFSQFLNFSSFFGFPPGFAWMAFFNSSMLANSFGARTTGR